jgi:membrane-bound serine protease (ClpP class)
MKSLLRAFLALTLATTAFGADQPAGPEAPTDTPAVTVQTPVPAAAEPATPAAEAPALPPITAGEDGKLTFYVLPIREQIGEPILFIVRNGVKEAIAAQADCVVLDMNTPGGELGVTLEIMEILAKFDGPTVTFVNEDAISAGAFISAATDRIYFAPDGVIGAAAPVSGGGEDIDVTMKQKVVSYLRARVRAISEEHPYRGDVVSAMMDDNFELKVDDKVIKPKGELLSLTATEAVKTYGTPPQPLLGAGIADDLPALYRALAGSGDFSVREFQMTWSLNLAVWLMNLSPLLLAIGGLMLAIEFKTPGFGWVGITGIALIVIVIFGHNVAGLSGHEAMLVFILGVALVFVEILLFPGMIIFGALGVLLMLGALLWGMADIWPAQTEGVDISWNTFLGPAYTLSLALLIGIGLFAIVVRFLPKTTAWNRLVLAAEIHGTATTPVDAAGDTTAAIGVVVSPLHPTGTIDVGGRRLEARSELGEIAAGTRVRIVRRSDFVVIVEPVDS